MPEEPKLIDLDKHFDDDRGTFTNIAVPFEVKRIYTISNWHEGIIRAFHGHNHESKAFFVLRGAMKLIVYKMDAESKKENLKEFVLSEKKPKLLVLPPGYYNGFASLTDDTILVVLSSSTMEESKNDDIRVPYDAFGKDVWEVRHR